MVFHTSTQILLHEHKSEVYFLIFIYSLFSDAVSSSLHEVQSNSIISELVVP